MKIYTRTGDQGETGLYRGQRVSKSSLRIHCIGETDELNAHLGLVLSENLPDSIRKLLTKIQHELFCLGAQLASEDPKQAQTNYLNLSHIQEIEVQIDLMEDVLPKMTAFILPSGCRASCLLHVARAVCRRLERSLTEMQKSVDDPCLLSALQYINRLSDLMFVMSRFVNQQAQCSETPWYAPKTE